jgi:ATP-dependent RNA helicase DDX1
LPLIAVDLKGEESLSPPYLLPKGKEHVPETVHHVIVPVDPSAEMSAEMSASDEAHGRGGGGGGGGGGDGALPRPKVTTDGVHASDAVGVAKRGSASIESYSEAIKRLKPHMLLQVVERLQMTQAIIFCRTNLDCDNLEAFLNAAGGGRAFKGMLAKGVENPTAC